MIFRLSNMAINDFDALMPKMQEIVVSSGSEVCAIGEMTKYVYFPSSSLFSIVTLLSDGRTFETSSIGSESAVGLLPAFTGIAPMTRVMVRIGGGATRVIVEDLKARASASPMLTRLIMRHIQLSDALAQQTIACNASHPLRQRLSRWLLTAHDRMDGSILALTQDDLGVMAAALRSSISLTASDLKRDGLIDYSRGQVRILDRAGLERSACECYAIDRAHRRLMVSDR